MRRTHTAALVIATGCVAAFVFLALFERREMSPGEPSSSELPSPSQRTDPPQLSSPTLFPEPLERRQPLTRQLGTGDEHRYRVIVGAGQFLHLVVEQQAVDLVATLVSPRGRELLEVDHPTGDRGPERVCAILGAGGEYQLRLVPLQASASGGYRLELIDLRPAAAGDELCGRALQAFRRAEELGRREGGETLHQAIELYGEAEKTWSAWEQTYQQAVTRRQIAEMWRRLGEVSSQMEAYRQALALTPGLSERFLEVDLRNELGYAHYLSGEPQLALASYRTARQLAGDQGYARGEATSLNNLGLLYKSQGELERALSRYEQALTVWRSLADRPRQATTLHNLGVTFTSLGRPRDALDALEEAWAIRRQQSGSRARASTLTAIGWARLLAGDTQLAIADLKRAIDLRRAAGDRRGEAITHDRLGSAYLEQGELAAASASFEHARTLLDEVGDRFSLAHVIANLGWLHLVWEQPQQSLRHFDDAIARLRLLGDTDGEAHVLLGQARAERQLGRLDTAWARIDEALAKIESLRSGAGSQRLRTSFLASRQDFFELAVALQMQLDARQPGRGHAAQAFERSEQARARGLLEQLTAARVADQEGVERLQEQLNAVDRQRQRSDVRDRQRIADLEREQRRLLLALDRASSREQQATTLSGRPASLAEIQRQLDDETVLLAYALGEERSFVWAIGHDSWESHPLPAREEIEEPARLLYDNLASGSGRRSRTQAQLLARALGDLLLSPVGPRLASAKRLLIVADGLLSLVPWSALADPRDEAAGDPLMVRYELVQLPSASVLVALAERASRRTPAAGTLAVVADPVFTQDDPRVTELAREAPFVTTASGDEAFPRLPFSRREAEAILRLVPADERFARLDFAANRETVTSGALAAYRVVHFATHGVLHEEHPELSGIVLSGVDEHGRQRDGRLRVHEITRLDLPAELVVLSACRTALGTRVRGEGLVGLTRGFLAAGASRLVVSLWSVRDRATSRLMQRFYQGLFQQGLTPAAALRRAQLWMREQPDVAAPYFWAGFVFEGDWR